MIEAPVPDVVFDCNTYLQASLGTDGPASRCLHLLESGVYTLFVSRGVLDEVIDVLSRPALREKFPALTPESLAELLDRLDRYAVLTYNVPQTFRYARDPDDEPYVNLALVTKAHYLVSRDSDLLDLMAGQTEESRRFRRQYPDLNIVDPVGFLQALGR